MATLSRPFDETDWSAFCGAESWSDDCPPVMRELGELCLAIADRNGCELILSADADWTDPESYRLDHQFISQAEGRAFIDGLPEELTEQRAVEFGFEKI